MTNQPDQTDEFTLDWVGFIPDQKAKKGLKYSREHSVERKSFDEFHRRLNQRFPDGDELYIQSFYETMYVIDKRVRFVVNAYINSGRTINRKIKRVIRNRIKRKKNFIFEVIGATGEGKSWFAQNLAFLYLEILGYAALFHFDPDDLDKTFLFPDDDIDRLNAYFTYDFSTSSRVLQDTLKPQEIVIQDESEKMHGDGSQIEMDMLHNAIRTCTRKRRLNFIFCSPNRIQIPEVRAYFHIISINVTDRTTLALVSVPDIQDDKTIFPIGIFTIRARQTTAFEERYERFSEQVKIRIQARGGLSSPRVDDVKDDAATIVNRFNQLTDDEDRRYYTSTMRAFEEFVAMQNDLGLAGKKLKYVANRAAWRLGIGTRKKHDDLDDFSDHEAPVQTIDDVIQERIKSLEPETHCCECTPGDRFQPHLVHVQYPVCTCDPTKYVLKRNERNEMPRFVFDENTALAEMLAKDRERWEIKIEAFKRYRDGTGETQDNICLDFISRGIKCKARTVGNWIASVKGEIADRRGEAYEPHYTGWANSTGEFTSVKNMGGTGAKGHGKADVVRIRKDGVHEVVQLKCYNTSESRNGCNIPIDKFAPEIKRVRGLKKQGIPAICIGHVYFYELGYYREQFIDIDHLPVSISFPL